MSFPRVGIIGAGDMGKLYARSLSGAGYLVSVSDLPQRLDDVKKELTGTKINVVHDAYCLSGVSDVIIYAVPVENIDVAVQNYGNSTKGGTLVLGASSVKTPELRAFERHLNQNVSIGGFHSLHGPSVSPIGQTAVLIDYRMMGDEHRKLARDLVSGLGSKLVVLDDADEHDRITADTQVATHLGFLSMGTAWKDAEVYPWLEGSYARGIDRMKALMMFRILGGKPHVYSGLAFFNPHAKKHADAYAKSTSELFELFITQNEKGLRERVMSTKQAIFEQGNKPLKLPNAVMREFYLDRKRGSLPNSHLSLLAIADAWHQLGINPYNNMLCETPPSRLRLGIVEHLFRDNKMLEGAIKAVHCKKIRKDDLKFYDAVNTWARIIRGNDAQGYNELFNSTKAFFVDKIPEAKTLSDRLIARLAQN